MNLSAQQSSTQPGTELLEISLEGWRAEGKKLVFDRGFPQEEIECIEYTPGLWLVLRPYCTHKSR